MVKVFNTDTDTLATEEIMCGVRLTKLELTFLRLAINNCWRIKYGDESNSENNRQDETEPVVVTVDIKGMKCMRKYR